MTAYVPQTTEMLEQDRFRSDLARILTPLPFRDGDTNSDGADVNTSSWYNTPGVTVAAVTSSVASGYNACHAEWGTRQLPGGPSPDTDTLFQACSISKAFQSLAILHYISEGVISGLDEPIKPYLSEETYRTLLGNSIEKGVPEKLAAQLLNQMSIIQLLSHTAGSTASGFQGYPTSSSHIPSTIEVLQGGSGNANSPSVLVHAIPGVQFEYSGGGSTILQAMLENIGSSRDGFLFFAALMKAKVLEPLGMTRSFYCDGSALPQSEKNYATGYHNGTHGLEWGEYHVHPEQGAAGLWTSSSDLIRGMTGFAHSLLGTASAAKLDGKPWVRPQFAQEILRKRAELGHGESFYYCGFVVDFFDGEDNFSRDKDLVRISHAGGNYGYRCWTGVAFPLPGKLTGSKEDITIKAQAVMTNSNCGGEIVGPLVSAIAEMLDSPLGPQDSAGAPHGGATPAIALDPTPMAPATGWNAYEGEWVIKDRMQTLRIQAEPSPVVVFSHLESAALPLWAVAEREGPEAVRLRVSTLEVTLEFGFKQEKGEVSLMLCTGGSDIKCFKRDAAQMLDVSRR